MPKQKKVAKKAARKTVSKVNDKKKLTPQKKVGKKPFNLNSTTTGRWSSKKPNESNKPMRGGSTVTGRFRGKTFDEIDKPKPARSLKDIAKQYTNPAMSPLSATPLPADTVELNPAVEAAARQVDTPETVAAKASMGRTVGQMFQNVMEGKDPTPAEAPKVFEPHAKVVGDSSPPEENNGEPTFSYRVEYEIVEGKPQRMLLESTDKPAAMEEAAGLCGLPVEAIAYEDE